MSQLTLHSVSKTFGKQSEHPAVSNVSLNVPPGETMAIVGESGSGKTTLLRMIAGLELPDQGEIRIGKTLASSPTSLVPPERRGVGLVFQDGALFPHLTISKTLYLL